MRSTISARSRRLLRARLRCAFLTAILLGLMLPGQSAYPGPLPDETSLTPAEQNKRNKASRAAIGAAILTHNAGVIAGVLPWPSVQYAGEAAMIAMDSSLKFAKPVLYAPGTKWREPNSADDCSFEYTLPQTEATFRNQFGIWPTLNWKRYTPFIKFDNDLTLFPPVSWGPLGNPKVWHAHTDVVLSVSSESAGIQRMPADPNPLANNSQQIVTPAGRHIIEWRSESLTNYVFDTVIPVVLFPIGIAAETKYAKFVKKINAKKSNPDLGEVKDIADLTRKLKKLNRQVNFVERVKKVQKFKETKKGKVLNKALEKGVDGLVNLLLDDSVSAYRIRHQILNVYDVLPPQISTSQSDITFEATDVGGTKAFKHLPELLELITASDSCGRPVNVRNDAPEFFPIGEPTLVTWTASDLGPAPPEVGTDVNETIITQLITVADTQAPIIVPPPAIVIEGNSNVSIADEALGQPLVVDLADLHPDVTNSAPADEVMPDSRLVVTWAATDESGNTSFAEQLVTVKTPGSNNPPTAYPNSAVTLTSDPVDIILTGSDPDKLSGRTDPLMFSIVDRPTDGEFIAPLLPYFIEDYRTDSTGVLTDDVAFAQATNQLNWLDVEHCQQGADIPTEFVFNPLFVHATDDGEHYFLDHYAECVSNAPAISTLRISRWDKDRNFLGQIDYNPSEGVHNSSFVVDGDSLYYLLSFGVNEFTLQLCDRHFTGTNSSCSTGYNFPDNIEEFDVSRSTYALPDSDAPGLTTDPLIYLTDKNGVNVYEGQAFKGVLDVALADGSRNPDFLTSNTSCQPISGGIGNQAFGMALDSRRDFYIADSCTHRIHKFSASELDSEGNLIAGEYIGWMGACTSSTNLACDETNQRSKGFSCTDTTCTVSGDGSGSAPGQFKHPVFLAMDPNDTLYVADYSNQRVQRFAEDGSYAGQAKSTGNGINANIEGAFVLGNMGAPRHVSVNSEQFFVVDQQEKFVHVFETSPFKDITDNSATVSYVSDFAFHSDADTFTFAVDDGLVESNPATVTITVNRNHRAPIAEPYAVVGNEDEELTFTLDGADPDGILNRDFNGLDTLTFTVEEAPVNGVLDCQPEHEGAATCTYLPAREFNGTDRFTYYVTDDDPNGNLSSEAVVVDILINPVNDAPVLNLEPEQRVAAGFPFLLEASFTDEADADYSASLLWGDGSVDRIGRTVVNWDDQTTSIEGVAVFSEALAFGESGAAYATHTYTAPANRTLVLCLRDDGRGEGCTTSSISVEPAVVFSTDIGVPDAAVADDEAFSIPIEIVNEIPDGIPGLTASNVTVTAAIPAELTLTGVTSSGSCTTTTTDVICDFGNLPPGAGATLALSYVHSGTLIYDTDVQQDVEITTDALMLAEAALAEAAFSLVANQNDSDGDGMSDVYEAVYAVADAGADADGDGLSNGEEFDLESSPNDPDSDDDGLKDGDEQNAHATDLFDADSDGDGLTDGDEVNSIGTDPLAADSDGDSIRDDIEIDLGLDPLSDADGDFDLDGDGLSNSMEGSLGTDLNSSDTDADGISDADEVNVTGTDPVLEDTDADGLLDGAETATGVFADLNNTGTDPLKADTDDDGLKDGAEILDHLTDPHRRDTDLDDLPDGWEVGQGRSPIAADYQLAAGGFHGCALTDSGVQCWGLNAQGQAPALVPGLNNPLQVASGYRHSCALDDLGGGATAVVCWGSDIYDQSTPVLLEHPIEIALGSWHTCALDDTAQGTEIKCWGLENGGNISDTPTGLENPTQLVASASSNCVLDGSNLVCWGTDVSGAPVSATSPGALSLGTQHGCIVDELPSGATLNCWGDDSAGQVTGAPAFNQVVQLGLGASHSCALDQLDAESTQTACWGTLDPAVPFQPESLVRPKQLTSFLNHTCVLDQGAGVCWGAEGNNRNNVPALLIDPDADGVTTAQEIANLMDPLDPDTDRDGLPDGDELYGHLTPPTVADGDGDGLSDGFEVANGMDPGNPDENGNGTPDGDDDLDNDGLNNAAEANSDSDYAVPDTDGDGLLDGFEVDYGLNPLDADENDNGNADGDDDFDNDGLSNLAEVELGTDYRYADTDQDELPDGYEVDYDMNPLSGDENSNSMADGLDDTDADGLSNREEAELGTNPNESDTDGDGMTDAEEVADGFDPLDSLSCSHDLCPRSSSILKIIRILQQKSLTN